MQDYEFTCDIDACYSKELGGITLKGKDIITMIDEIPIFCIVAAMSKGKTIWEAAYIGALAAAYQVGKVGNTPIPLNELKKELSG